MTADANYECRLFIIPLYHIAGTTGAISDSVEVNLRQISISMKNSRNRLESMSILQSTLASKHQL